LPRPYRPQAKVEAAAAIDYDAVGTIRYRDDQTLAGGSSSRPPSSPENRQCPAAARGLPRL
jgi:hypothetical protein